MCARARARRRGKEPAQNIIFLMVLCPKIKKRVEEVEKSFLQRGMEGCHIMKNKGNKKTHVPSRKSFITPSLHSCFFQDHTTLYCQHLEVFVLFPLPYSSYIHNKFYKDIGMGL